ncbi:12504_t:CDS:1, partial [Gigaspora rosea]
NKVGYLKQFTGYQLFGLDYQYVQKLIQEIHVPNCLLLDWNNDNLMASVYKYHLNRYTYAQVNWKQLFSDWLSQEHTIIELQLTLQNLYPKNYT